MYYQKFAQHLHIISVQRSRLPCENSRAVPI